MPVTYYSDTAEAALIVPGTTADDFQESWQAQIDDLIEQHAHQSYKGNTLSYVVIGDGNTLISLPSRAQSITSITENGTTLDTSEYNFHGPSRIIERRNTSFYLYLYGPNPRTGQWWQDAEYIVTYVEPTTVPERWKATANQCLAVYYMMAQKFGSDGMAITISNSGQASGGGSMVQSGGSVTFPANLMEELQRTIQFGIPKVAL